MRFPFCGHVESWFSTAAGVRTAGSLAQHRPPGPIWELLIHQDWGFSGPPRGPGSCWPWGPTSRTTDVNNGYSKSRERQITEASSSASPGLWVVTDRGARVRKRLGETDWAGRRVSRAEPLPVSLRQAAICPGALHQRARNHETQGVPLKCRFYLSPWDPRGTFPGAAQRGQGSGEGGSPAPATVTEPTQPLPHSGFIKRRQSCPIWWHPAPEWEMVCAATI